MEDALAATVGAFQAHLVRVVEERKRLRDVRCVGCVGTRGAAGSAAPAPPRAPEVPGAFRKRLGTPPRARATRRSSAPSSSARRRAARLQRKREEAVRGALESENAAARAKEERDEMAREERARADAAEQDLDSAVEKFRVLRAEVARLREDAENLRKVNRALSRELYGNGGGSHSHAENPHQPIISTPSRGDLRREFESGGDEAHAANAFLRESGVAAAALEGVGALEERGAARRSGAGDGSRAAGEAEEAFGDGGRRVEPVHRDDFLARRRRAARPAREGLG